MAKLWKYLRKLKKDFPLKKPVKVRTYASLKYGKDKLFGCIEDRGSHYLICLWRRPDVSIMVDTLWHEWTHALLWPRCRFRHSKKFWEVYGRIYSKYQDT